MRVRGVGALEGKDIASSSFETIRILGKGSFGVVRLVREKSESRWVGGVLTNIKSTAD